MGETNGWRKRYNKCLLSRSKTRALIYQGSPQKTVECFSEFFSQGSTKRRIHPRGSLWWGPLCWHSLSFPSSYRLHGSVPILGHSWFHSKRTRTALGQMLSAQSELKPKQNCLLQLLLESIADLEHRSRMSEALETISRVVTFK